MIEDVEVHDSDGQPLYSYLSEGLMVKRSHGSGGKVLNEFAATVDLTVQNSTFESNEAALGLDFGTGFFLITGNQVPASENIGMYLLDGVHDGTVSGNLIDLVRSSNSAIGMLARGTANVNIVGNYLQGGEGPVSIGLSIGPAYTLDEPILSSGNTVSPNWFGPCWTMEYDPTNLPK